MNKIVSLLMPKLFMCPFISLQFDEYASKVTPTSETHVQPQTQNNKTQGNSLEKMGCYGLDRVLLVAEARRQNQSQMQRDPYKELSYYLSDEFPDPKAYNNDIVHWWKVCVH